MRSYEGRVGPSSNMTGSLTRRGLCEDTDPRGEHHVMMKAGLGVLQLQASDPPKDSSRPPDAIKESPADPSISNF